MDLLDDDRLQRSAVVANCRMNRERDLLGSNGYDRELGLDPLAFLKGRAAGHPAAWLDLCCGAGKALIQAAEAVHAGGLEVEIVGVDLVGDQRQLDFPVVLPQPRMLPVGRQAKRGTLPPS
jgi:SAM-dependent methyltransferase